MRPSGRLAAALIIFVIVTGCAPKASQDEDPALFEVLFEGMANIYDSGVYHDGARIGEIQSSMLGPGNVTKTTVRLSPQAAQHLTNAVFYIALGRLEVARLQGPDAIYEKGEPLCGFTSKAQLNWFKFKTLMNDRPLAAKQRARTLQARSN